MTTSRKPAFPSRPVPTAQHGHASPLLHLAAWQKPSPPRRPTTIALAPARHAAEAPPSPARTPPLTRAHAPARLPPSGRAELLTAGVWFSGYKKNESLETELDMLEAQVARLKFDAEASNAFVDIEPSDIDDAIKNLKHFAMGGSGVVYKAELGGTYVAIKVPRDVNLPQEKKAFKDEVEILGRIRHPYIVILHGACVEKCALVYEFLPNGTLEERLEEGKGKDTFPWEERINVAANISSALVHLHDSSPHPIAHGDLKPNNILFDAENICKLGDFGISRFMRHNTTGGTPCHNTDEPKGTGSFMDPDFNDGNKKLTCLADQFAFGIILLQLVTGRDALGLRKLVSEQMKTLAGKSTDLKIRFLSKLDLMDTTWKSNDKSKEVALEILSLGLRCSEEKRKDRPDFNEEVWTKIKSITCEKVPGTVVSPKE